jgi:hypothetical protein
MKQWLKQKWQALRTPKVDAVPVPPPLRHQKTAERFAQEGHPDFHPDGSLKRVTLRNGKQIDV